LEKRISEERQDELKAIVFVETKVSAERLAERLRTQFPNLNPQVMIGHAGMTTPKQREVLEEFRRGGSGVWGMTFI
jgi:ERCC4-related helicase